MPISTSCSSPLSLDHQHQLPPSDQLCYVHCNICDTVLAVSVPSTSLFKVVTVRCGHCANLFPVVNMLLSSANQFQFGHSFYFPPPPPPAHNYLLEEVLNPSSNVLINHQNDCSLAGCRRLNELPKSPVTNRPPEKRQRVPSAYNRFIKEEIQRIKSVNPDISHREAFS